MYRYMPLIRLVMNDHIKTHFKELAARLSNIKRIGAMTVVTLLSEIPELGSLSRREIIVHL
ncbi:Uncharacterised protein [Salmonella enterica subsp. enterica serovar Typhi]|nr:Uncharacterised protein [Salmonella enterica subsp. enterica serovar Typhi]